jgi:hypothetical protein
MGRSPRALVHPHTQRPLLRGATHREQKFPPLNRLLRVAPKLRQRRSPQAAGSARDAARLGRHAGQLFATALAVGAAQLHVEHVRVVVPARSRRGAGGLDRSDRLQFRHRSASTSLRWHSMATRTWALRGELNGPIERRGLDVEHIENDRESVRRGVEIVTRSDAPIARDRADLSNDAAPSLELVRSAMDATLEAHQPFPTFAADRLSDILARSARCPNSLGSGEATRPTVWSGVAGEKHGARAQRISKFSTAARLATIVSAAP